MNTSEAARLSNLTTCCIEICLVLVLASYPDLNKMVNGILVIWVAAVVLAWDLEDGFPGERERANHCVYPHVDTETCQIASICISPSIQHYKRRPAPYLAKLLSVRDTRLQ